MILVIVAMLGVYIVTAIAALMYMMEINISGRTKIAMLRKCLYIALTIYTLPLILATEITVAIPKVKGIYDKIGEERVRGI